MNKSKKKRGPEGKTLAEVLMQGAGVIDTAKNEKKAPIVWAKDNYKTDFFGNIKRKR